MSGVHTEHTEEHNHAAPNGESSRSTEPTSQPSEEHNHTAPQNEENLPSPKPIITNGVDSLIVAKAGDKYYPTEPAYYVGGDIYTVIANSEETGGAFEFLDFYVPPRDVIPQHTHAHEAEAKYILEGEVSFYFGDGTLTAPPGTFVYYPQGRPMGFLATEDPARLAVTVVPGAPFYELAGVPVDEPPPQADLAALQQQVDLPQVAEINDTYGGKFYTPETSSAPSGLGDTVLVVPEDSVTPEQLNALADVEGLSVFELDQRPTVSGPFGIEYTALATPEETDGNLAYNQFSLNSQSKFPEAIVSEDHQFYYVKQGKLSVKIGEETKVADPDTFVYVAPGESYAIANLGTKPVTALSATVTDTYIPKIGQYLTGNEEFLATIRAGDEYIQGNVIATEPKPIGDGWIYTWGALAEENTPTSIGVTFTTDALSNPEGVDMFELDDPDNEFPRSVPHLALSEQFDPARVYNISFPDQVVAATPFNHMGFYANSQGHAPLGVYDQPHLDIHFFINTLGERELITGAPEDNVNLFDTPPLGYLNRDYFAPTVPDTDIIATGDALQGVHWVDRDAPEINGEEFSQTFIFGSYANEVNFWEPMITKEFLEDLSAAGKSTKQTYPIKQPARFLETGYYPLEYSIAYNADFAEYTVSLDNFVLRQADILYGNTMNSEDDDIIYATAAGDNLSGDSGTDALVAGSGSDLLSGGSGFDHFIFQKEFTAPGTETSQGGYGGDDVITDYQAEAGIGDTIKLRNLDNSTGINIRDDGNGNTVIAIENRSNIDPTAGSSGTGNYAPVVIQTITVEGVSANQLMTQGLIEVNGLPLNETTQGVTKSFGTFDYVVGGLSATFPTRPGGVAGNSVFGDPAFGQPDVAPENNLVTGDFVEAEKLADLLQQIAGNTTEITIPGTDADLPAELRAELEAQKVIGEIPESALPQNAFSFAFNQAGEVDLSKFTPTVDPATINDDLIVGGPGNDFLVSGPGNDTIVGGQGTDIIWAGAGQDIIVGRESVDYIIFDSILDFRDRDVVEEDAISNAVPDARVGYIRYEEPYGTELADPFTTKTGPDVLMVNSQAFNRGIDPETNPELAEQIGYLQPGTIISGDGTGAAASQNGQLKIGQSTVPTSDGPAAEDMQPTFYYSPNAGRLFFDRDGTGTAFGDFWMADMANGGIGSLELPNGTPTAAPELLIYVY